MARPESGGHRRNGWPLGVVLAAVVMLLGVQVLAPTPADAADIVYLYDRLGRLIAVVDPASDTAVYSYDAVGNLLGIARQSSSTVSVIGFDPPSGPVGATVTVQGTGFSATPAQNTVTFNGVTATVSAATANQLTVTVPSGATTGTIGVTAPGGSGTSAVSFTVTSTSGSPTITSFTPTIGAAGTSVTVSGTNFDTVAANDRLRFNRAQGFVSSATSTSLTVPVPAGGTSGRLSVVTPAGSGQSTDDFFIPPNGGAASAVAFTGRASIGGSGVSVSMTTAGKNALVVFDGTAGQPFAAGFTGVSIATAFGTLFRPDGVQLATANATTTSGAENSMHATLPMTGTYTLQFVPNYFFGWQTGSFTLTLSEDPASVPIVIDGSAVTMTLARAGQHQAATFTGTAGQRLSLAFTSVTLGAADVTIRKPDGSTLTSSAVWDGVALDLPDLPATGTYTIWVDPQGAATGSLTLTLSAEIAAGTLAIDGSSNTLTFTRAGQRARATFSGTAGQRLSLGYTSVTTGWPTNIYVYKPDGSVLTSQGTAGDGAKVFPVLPTTGTYSILVDPPGPNTGTVILWLSSEVTNSISIGGSSVSVSVTRPGQRARLTFSGTASERVSMKLTGSGFPYWGWVSVLRPDESYMGGTGPSNGNFMNPVTLPSTSSTYSVFVDPSNTETGSVTVQLYDVPADLTGSLTINGSPLTLTFAAPGQKASITFTATDGQALTLVVANNTSGICFSLFQLVRANGQAPGWGNVCGNPISIGTGAGGNGTHTINLDPGSYTGSIDLSVTSP
jgi:YD repeat-containing protein